MQIRVQTITVIDSETGKAETSTTYRVIGATGGINEALAQVMSAIPSDGAGGVVTTPPASPEPSNYTHVNVTAPGSLDTRSADINQARRLAAMIGIAAADVEQAINTRPPGRVREVLEWLRSKRATTSIKHPTALFWSVVNRDA
jgi:threonine dehydrogenase-like Zn-dependent dehydrogenase